MAAAQAAADWIQIPRQRSVWTCPCCVVRQVEHWASEPVLVAAAYSECPGTPTGHASCNVGGVLHVKQLSYTPPSIQPGSIKNARKVKASSHKQQCSLYAGGS